MNDLMMQHENLLEIAHFANTAEEQILHDADGGIVLCKLGPRQKLRVECVARLVRETNNQRND